MPTERGAEPEALQSMRGMSAGGELFYYAAAEHDAGYRLMGDMADLLNYVDALQQSREAMGRDAERYRAVRYVLCERYGFGVNGKTVRVQSDDIRPLSRDEFDKSVDTFTWIAEKNMRIERESAECDAVRGSR